MATRKRAAADGPSAQVAGQEQAKVVHQYKCRRRIKMSPLCQVQMSLERAWAGARPQRSAAPTIACCNADSRTTPAHKKRLCMIRVRSARAAAAPGLPNSART